MKEWIKQNYNAHNYDFFFSQHAQMLYSALPDA